MQTAAAATESAEPTESAVLWTVSVFSFLFLSCFPRVLVALFSALCCLCLPVRCDVTCNYLRDSRYGSNGDAVEAPDGPSPASISMSRRPSFRAIVPPTLYDADSSDQPGKWRHLCSGLEMLTGSILTLRGHWSRTWCVCLSLQACSVSVCKGI